MTDCVHCVWVHMNLYLYTCIMLIVTSLYTHIYMRPFVWERNQLFIEGSCSDGRKDFG